MKVSDLSVASEFVGAWWNAPTGWEVRERERSWRELGLRARGSSCCGMVEWRGIMEKMGVEGVGSGDHMGPTLMGFIQGLRGL